MTLISSLLFILSTVGVLGFACWDNDLEIPFFYSFGQFEAHWWFNDKLKPGKPHLEQHDKDGPPLVARTTTGGGGITWGDSIKMSSTYTPINGMYGVTNQKEVDRTLSLEYYPNASDPADYIVNRLIGPQADWSELEDMGDRLKLYNTKVFKAGTPFKSALIGPGKSQDPAWAAMPNYDGAQNGAPFLPPLTSTGAGYCVDEAIGGGYNIPRSVNDYSGGEYNGGDPTFANTIEYQAVNGQRQPQIYQEDMNANTLSPDQSKIAVWPGDMPLLPTYDTGYPLIMNSFSDSQYSGHQLGIANGATVTQYPWGTKGITQPNYWGKTPTDIQMDYITKELTQENPVTASTVVISKP